MDGPRVTGDIGGGDDSSASDASSDSESGFLPPAGVDESVADEADDDDVELEVNAEAAALLAARSVVRTNDSNDKAAAPSEPVTRAAAIGFSVLRACQEG